MIHLQTDWGGGMCVGVCVWVWVCGFADTDHFEIDQRSGDIRTSTQFSQSPQTHYTLAVVARDGGPTPLEEKAVIHLQVQTQCMLK